MGIDHVLDVAERDAAGDDGEGGGGLAPLPKRVDDELAALPPIEVVDQLLERTAALLRTLDTDEAGLAEDEEEQRLRIEAEKKEYRAAAERALDELGQFGAEAEKIATKKGKLDVLQQSMARARPPKGKLDYAQIRTELLDELRTARGITGAIRLPRIGELLVTIGAAVEQMVDEAEHYTERRLREAAQETQTETKEARASFDIGLMVLNRDLVTLDEALPTAARPWGSPAWHGWHPPADDTTQTVVRLGGLADPRLPAELPMLWAFPPEEGLFLDPGAQHREAAIAAVQSLTLRVLCAMPPGSVRVSVIDPKGLGDAAAPLMGFAEHGDVVLGESVATTGPDIDQVLGETSRHIERVVQHYLRGRFATLAEANAAAGEIVEPYRLLLVFDHPAGLSEASTAMLAAIAANGPRCGVFPIITKQAQVGQAFATAWNAPKLDGLTMHKADKHGFAVTFRKAGTWQVRFDEPPAAGHVDALDLTGGPVTDDVDTGIDIGPTVEIGPVDPMLLDRLVATIGGGATARRERSVAIDRLFAVFGRGGGIGGATLDRPVDPEQSSTWWQASSAHGLLVPIGRTGADATAVRLDASRSGLLVIGRPGSGIGNALTALVLGLGLIYGPDELELRLLGMGTTPELGRFAEHALPHASIVADEADPALVVSVLADLVDELERRYELLRSTVGERAGLGAYRDETGERLPRIVCLIDQFGALARRRPGTADPTPLLDRLARLGGPVGIQLVLATSTADADAKDLGVVDLLGPRLLLRMDDDDARRFAGEELADEVRAAALPGDASLLAAPGDVASHRSLRTVLVEPLDLELCLREVRRLADERGTGRRPRVVSGRKPARFEQADLATFVRRAATDVRTTSLLLGDPIQLGPPVELDLRRRDGENVLALTPDAAQGQGLLLAAVTSAVFAQGGHLATMALDFMPMEDGFTESMHVLGAGPWTIQPARRRSMAQVLDVIARIVRDRTDADDARAKTVLLVLNGLGRARELTLDAGGAPEAEAAHLYEQLEVIVRHGPEVGVHTLAWCDSLERLERRLPPRLLDGFARRIAGPASAEDGVVFADTETTATLSANQAVLVDVDQGRLETFAPYAAPPRDWLLRAVQAASGHTDD